MGVEVIDVWKFEIGGRVIGVGEVLEDYKLEKKKMRKKIVKRYGKDIVYGEKVLILRDNNKKR